jgi:predicted nuclease of predicted toxin-antitoxin system
MIWLDAHLSPRLAEWMRQSLGHAAKAIRDLGLRDADDLEFSGVDSVMELNFHKPISK